MTTQPQEATPAAPDNNAKKPDFVTLPMVAVLVSCVLAAMGNSRESALLTWQLPLALVVGSFAWVRFRAMRARRRPQTI